MIHVFISAREIWRYPTHHVSTTQLSILYIHPSTHFRYTKACLQNIYQISPAMNSVRPTLANRMRLASLPLQAVLLILIMRAVVLRLARMSSMLVDMLVVLLNLLRLHSVQDLHAQLDIVQQLVTSRLGEVLSDDNSQHLEIVGVRSHGIGWHDPRALAELVSESEFVVVLVGLFVQTEGHERQTGAVLLGHDFEAQLLQ
jgi:hypothetical protein